jgi:ketosteroid isomerase-like protein
MESAVAIATLNEFVRCINAHDPKGIVSLCTADHIFIDSLGSQLSGLDQLEQAWAGYFSLFPDYRIDVEAVVSQNAVVLACGFASATHAASKKSWRIPAAWRAIVRNGRLAEWQVYADNMSCCPNMPNQSGQANEFQYEL